MRNFTVRWIDLQGPTTDDLWELISDISNAIVSLVVLFGSIAWLISALFPQA